MNFFGCFVLFYYFCKRYSRELLSNLNSKGDLETNIYIIIIIINKNERDL